MNNIKSKTIMLLFTLFLSFSLSQTKNDGLQNTPQSKYLTYSEETSFCDFVDYIDFLYQKYDGKSLTIQTDCRFPIGVNLTQVLYSKALREVCLNKHLSVVEKENHIVISKNSAEKESVKNTITQLLDCKQVKITAILFEANIDKMNERGVNWNFKVSKSGLQSSGGFHSKGSNSANVAINVATDFYKFSGFTSAMFKFFESHNLGKVISKMAVTVRDGKIGKMQVGSDISVKQLDFAGNVTDAFFPTGTIINVQPNVYNKDTLNFALIKVQVERSIPYLGNVSTEIKKTLTDTEVLLRDGEETVIGSLLLEENEVVREGIPILKDLPWWVFGIRYLTGYNSKILQHKEVVMLMKAEIIPPISSTDFTDKLLNENIQFKSNELEKLNNLK